MIDILGFAGSGLIVLSLTMKSMTRLRVVGLMGASVFILYGLWLGAWPVVVTNTVTLSIHLTHLRRLLREPADSGPLPESASAVPSTGPADRLPTEAGGLTPYDLLGSPAGPDEADPDA